MGVRITVGKSGRCFKEEQIMISLQQQAAKMTQEALDSLIRTTRYLPEDQLEWSPMGAARPVMDQLAEIIQFAETVCLILTADYMPAGYGRAQVQDRKRQILENYKTLKDITSLAQAKYNELFEVLTNTPDSRLDQEYRLPQAPGKRFSGVDILFLPYWNLVYHFGQINYIQTMLGDTEMH
jgi:hypothetical protein